MFFYVFRIFFTLFILLKNIKGIFYMKFSQKLNAYLTSEWRQQYISYADLKISILNAVENAPLKESSTDRIISNYYANFEDGFFFDCGKELQKINTFYAEKISEATRRNEFLSKALDLITGESRLRKVTTKKRVKNIKMADLKNGFSELYLSLVLLHNYKMLNYTGFKKILKKHDKVLHNTQGMKWFEENISTAYFYTDGELDRLMHAVENDFTEYLENGDRAEAMKRLRVPPLNEIQQIGTIFRVGLFLGGFIVLLGSILILCMYSNPTVCLDIHYREYKMVTSALFGNSQSNSQSVNIHNLILFRAPFYVIMYLFLVGINVFSWRRFGVNYILIFEINPRNHLTYSNLLELHAIFGFIWSLCVFGYFQTDKLNIPKLLLPLLLFGIMLVFLLNPLPLLYRSARYWLLKVVSRVIMAPLFTVGFADFWFGDQLNSMVACLLDFKYLLCFYLSNTNLNEEFKSNQCLANDYIGNAVVRCLPSWFRFAQCLRRYCDTYQAFPFLVNAGKYATTFPVVIFATLAAKYNNSYEYTFQSPFLWFYLVSAILNSCYCCCYDILRDFGLFQTFSGKNAFLREQIIYSPSFYYFAIVQNIILRFFWAISLFLVTHNCINTHDMDSLAGCLEIIRRYIWNYIRLENEHLFNVGQFRAVRDIFLAPMDTRNSIEIQRMMDEVNGVVNRGSRDSNHVTATDEDEN